MMKWQLGLQCAVVIFYVICTECQGTSRIRQRGQRIARQINTGNTTQDIWSWSTWGSFTQKPAWDPWIAWTMTTTTRSWYQWTPSPWSSWSLWRTTTYKSSGWTGWNSWESNNGENRQFSVDGIIVTGVIIGVAIVIIGAVVCRYATKRQNQPRSETVANNNPEPLLVPSAPMVAPPAWNPGSARYLTQSTNQFSASSSEFYPNRQTVQTEVPLDSLLPPVYAEALDLEKYPSTSKLDITDQQQDPPTYTAATGDSSLTRNIPQNPHFNEPLEDAEAGYISDPGIGEGGVSTIEISQCDNNNEHDLNDSCDDSYYTSRL